jgi:aminoglycoside phosphotransferase (APT) family kinase protein
MSADALESLPELLARHGIEPSTEEPFPNDGWSGATMTRLRDGAGRGYVLKRDSLAADWIARATNDTSLRESWFAVHGPALPWPVRNPTLGAASTGAGEVAILMPDLSDILFDWNAPLRIDEFDAVLAALAALHAVDPPGPADAWTGWRERVTLICRSSLERPGPAHDAVADRLLPGWDAWDRTASAEARAIVDGLSRDVQPLLAALAGERPSLLHGDLKLANAGVASDGAVELVDWQMVMVAPVAVELGWFLVSNVNALPLPPAEVLERYWARRGLAGDREDDLAVLVGLLLRGWRKGFDAEAGITLASGMTAREDLAWWCRRAIEAAKRVL